MGLGKERVVLSVGAQERRGLLGLEVRRGEVLDGVVIGDEVGVLAGRIQRVALLGTSLFRPLGEALDDLGPASGVELFAS